MRAALTCYGSIPVPGRAAALPAMSFTSSMRPTALPVTDDRALHWPEHTEQLALLARRNLEFVKRLDEVLDERVELIASDVHALMRSCHVTPGVLARAAGAGAYLID